ncbi:hypothetical protein KCV06_g6707, partial [Aureobasidium melanogenum]
MEYSSGPEKPNTSSAILPLPENVVAQIKSSTTITSFNQVVLGLLENSLDAQATKIDIVIDYGRGGCTVEDNGIGILPSEYRATGGLGRLYHTSKQENDAQSQTHGGQGTFLASVGALSLLTITSRHAQHYSHNTLILHRSKVISRLTPTLPQHEIRSSTGYGTRVSIRDLFGNMPVRVKQRAIVAEEGIEAERQWQALKIGVVGFLLPWNRRVTLKVTDSENPARTFSINTGAQFLPNTLSERNLNTLNKKISGFDQGTILSILSQSGIISTDSKSSWIPVSASTSSVTVKGLISLEPAPSRIAQFMSIGIIPCLDENRHNELYEIVNRLFSQSTFGHIDEDTELDEAEMEEAMFRSHAGHFANWGILYDIISHTPQLPRLNILTLPPAISERCKAEPRLLIELLRSEIYSLAESSTTRTRPFELLDTDTNHAWLQRLGSCPKGILQLLNSRACRSAIMFNDTLTLQQCQRLIEEVARYDDEGDMRESLGGFGAKEEEKSEGFGSAYMKWRKKATK